METRTSIAPPLGSSALTPEILAAMNKEERDFWEKLNKLATKEVVSNKEVLTKGRYTPSRKLRELLLRAKNQYDGMRYCQMQQLAKIFEF